MDKRAVEHAERAFRRARRRLEEFGTATDIDEAEELWSEFLHWASKVHEKIRAGAPQNGDPDSWTWFKKKLDERENDELLAYMHHARNAEHHRLEDVAAAEKFVSINSRGTVLIDKLTISPEGPVGTWHPQGPSSKLIVEQTLKLRLVPVTDKGVTYPVPTRHRGDQTAVGRNPEKNGSLLLSYYKEVLLPEAASLLR
jgi:hypothetical protein